jgi:hypothetical protein
MKTLVRLGALAGPAMLALATVAPADSWKRVGEPGERMFTEKFAIPAGGEIEIALADADLELVRAEGREASVEVFVRARSQEKARDYYDEMRFSAAIEDGVLRVEAPGPRWHEGGFWQYHRDVQALVIVTVPDGGTLRAGTQDGDVHAVGIQGDISLVTQDGDVEVAGLGGPALALRTSDGDVSAERIRADRTELHTADGDLAARDIETRTLALRTSDGDVSVARAVAGEISVKTADGDVRLDTVEGEVNARTADGDIRVVLARAAAMDVHASDGDVVIVVPDGAGLTLDLKAERVSVSGASVKGDFGEHHFAGTVGDGGPTIAVRSMGGSVSLDVR